MVKNKKKAKKNLNKTLKTIQHKKKSKEPIKEINCRLLLHHPLPCSTIVPHSQPTNVCKRKIEKKSILEKCFMLHLDARYKTVHAHI